jgi:hypothetical protein
LDGVQEKLKMPNTVNQISQATDQLVQLALNTASQVQQGAQQIQQQAQGAPVVAPQQINSWFMRPSLGRDLVLAATGGIVALAAAYWFIKRDRG